METPFYMTYPLQSLYETQLEYERDFERIEEYLPFQVRSIMEVIKDHCDELEGEGSRIYDEQPDRYMLQKEVDTVWEKLCENHLEEESLHNLVEVLFYMEIYRRRCRFRKYHKWW